MQLGLDLTASETTPWAGVVHELSVRYSPVIATGVRRLNAPADVVEYLSAFARLRPEQESFWAVPCNRKNTPVGVFLVSVGTLTATMAHPREIFRLAVACAAASITVAHNHPSGDPAPSSADIQITRQLREAAKILDIALTDHVILGQPSQDPLGKGFYSFRQAGLL